MKEPVSRASREISNFRSSEERKREVSGQSTTRNLKMTETTIVRRPSIMKIQRQPVGFFLSA